MYDRFQTTATTARHDEIWPDEPRRARPDVEASGRTLEEATVSCEKWPVQGAASEHHAVGEGGAAGSADKPDRRVYAIRTSRTGGKFLVFVKNNKKHKIWV